jgi:hypothetical protein
MGEYPDPVWWVDADVCKVSIEEAGGTAGDGTVQEGNIALVLSGDSSYVIEGTRPEVLSMLGRALRAVGVE